MRQLDEPPTIAYCIVLIHGSAPMTSFLRFYTIHVNTTRITFNNDTRMVFLPCTIQWLRNDKTCKASGKCRKPE